ncbi:hypothetical protein RHMOL_Rhmol02G0117700 [Rhododendron molle]|uniref:Uncharacterized protein n=1 Tax=Rhododendron molle TaxID=49168 RepID=A0ACC0PS75_RHOML|nr:hypothetical protein RHMOL_Rhmol02G0117700 [Rhododendron molle]
MGRGQVAAESTRKKNLGQRSISRGMVDHPIKRHVYNIELDTCGNGPREGSHHGTPSDSTEGPKILRGGYDDRGPQKDPGVLFRPRRQGPEGTPRGVYDRRGSRPRSSGKWGSSCGLVAWDGGSVVEMRALPRERPPRRGELIQDLGARRGHVLGSHRSIVLGLTQAQVPYKYPRHSQ